MEEDSLKGKITINAIRWPAIIVEDSTEYLSALNRAIVHWCLVGEGCLLIDTLMRAAKAVIIDKFFQNATDGLNLSLINILTPEPPFNAIVTVVYYRYKRCELPFHLCAVVQPE